MSLDINREVDHFFVFVIALVVLFVNVRTVQFAFTSKASAFVRHIARQLLDAALQGKECAGSKTRQWLSNVNVKGYNACWMMWMILPGGHLIMYFMHYGIGCQSDIYIHGGSLTVALYSWGSSVTQLWLWKKLNYWRQKGSPTNWGYIWEVFDCRLLNSGPYVCIYHKLSVLWMLFIISGHHVVA